MLGKWAATLIIHCGKTKKTNALYRLLEKVVSLNIGFVRTQICCQPLLTIHSPSAAGKQRANPLARLSQYLLALGLMAWVTFILSSPDYSGHAEKKANCLPFYKWGKDAKRWSLRF